jgi:hypothetical protein
MAVKSFIAQAPGFSSLNSSLKKVYLFIFQTGSYKFLELCLFFKLVKCTRVHYTKVEVAVLVLSRFRQLAILSTCHFVNQQPTYFKSMERRSLSCLQEGV